AVLRERDPCPLHLAGARLAAQLGHELMDLPQARGADRMALGLQPARGIDRNAPADGRLPALAERSAFAEAAETEVLDLDDLAHGGGVVDLGDRDVLRPHP